MSLFSDRHQAGSDRLASEFAFCGEVSCWPLDADPTEANQIWLRQVQVSDERKERIRQDEHELKLRYVRWIRVNTNPSSLRFSGIENVQENTLFEVSELKATTRYVAKEVNTTTIGELEIKLELVKRVKMGSRESLGE